MADVAVVANHLASVTDVLAIVTTKTSGRIEMTNIVWVSRPISSHLGKEVSLEDSLRLANGGFDPVRFLSVQLAVVGPIKSIEP